MDINLPSTSDTIRVPKREVRWTWTLITIGFLLILGRLFCRTKE
jgi:hypothetical protein